MENSFDLPLVYCQDFEPRFLTTGSVLVASPVQSHFVSPKGQFPSFWGRSRRQKAHPIGQSPAPKVEASSDFVPTADARDVAKNVRAVADDCRCRRMASVLCCLGLSPHGRDTRLSVPDTGILGKSLDCPAAQLSHCNVTTTLSFFLSLFFRLKIHESVLPSSHYLGLRECPRTETK